jgi:outer membrane usher protein
VNPRGLAGLAFAALAAASPGSRAEGPTAAAAAASAPESDGQPAFLELFINGVAKPVVFALVREGDVLIDRRDLVSAGVPAQDAPAEIAGTRSLVSLRKLGPDVSFELDERALSLRLMLAPRFLGRTRLDLGPSPRPPGMDLRTDASGFVNYALLARSGLGVNAFLEAGASYRRGLFASGVSRLEDGSVVRGLTNASYDDVEDLRRYTAGDAVASGLGPLGGSVLLGGVSIARAFSLDPYQVHAPLPQAQGFALTPSILDVYVDGLLVRQQPLPPGTFELANLPVSSGAGVVRTVLRDAFGRTQDISTRYYFSSGLLSRGDSDYAVQLGARRNGFGTESLSYGPFALVARDRLGLTDALTVGGRLEALGAAVQSGGPSVSLALPAGELELTLAGSRDGDALGGGASAGYRFLSRQASAGVLLRLQSTRYATASLRSDQDRATFLTDAFASVPIGRRLAATVEYAAQTARDAGFGDRLSLRTDVQIGGGAAVSATLDRSRSGGGPPTAGFLVLLSWGFGERSTAAAFTGRTAGVSGGGVEAQRSLPLGEGAGYRVRAERGLLGDSALAQLQYQGPYGRYEAGIERAGTSTVATASVAGGLAAVGGRIFASRAIQDGYALIDVDGLSGVRGYLNNQEIGRTDSRGLLLVPALLPYYANRISIQGTDVPLDHQVGDTERLIASSLRGGALVRFDVRTLRVIGGRVAIARADGGRVVPAFGTLKVLGAGEHASSPLGAGGEFYLEDLPPGAHEAEIESEAGSCRIGLPIPEVATTMVDLGELICTEGR